MYGLYTRSWRCQNWTCFSLAQLIVLCSRLHLVADSECIQRSVFISDLRMYILLRHHDLDCRVVGLEHRL